MIDFEQLSRDLGGPVIEQPESAELNGDGIPHDYADEQAHREEGFEQVTELPPIVDSFDLEDREIATPPEIVKGLIHQGTKVVIGGGSKSFKTWSLVDLAHSVAYGTPWMGFECVPGRVIYINMEIHETFFQKRLKKVREAKGIEKVSNRLHVWNLRGHTASYRILIPQIIKRIKEMEYSLVVIDPIYKVYGNTDENSASEVGQLLNEMERMCVETGAAIAFGAHYSKGNQSGKEAIDRISGSGVFARDPDTIIPFTKHEEENCFVIEPILRNLAPVEPFVIRWNHPLFSRDEDLNPDNLKQANGGKKKEHDPLILLSKIRDRGKENPVSISDWAKLAGVKRTTLADYLPELRNLELIATIGEGTSAKKYITPKGVIQVSHLP